MSPAPRTSLTQFAVPAGVVAIVLMMIVPLPPAVLDLLIALNITGGLLVLLMAMYVRRPLDFAIFPSLILVATLFRLALNISVTRQVLVNGYAGKVVDAFGHFVIGGSLIVGLVVFFILVVIQFVVITNGAGRVAEVGARFTLDAMPGKQMAIDADLNAGLIDDEQARRRRREVAAEADFYGAMDGGSKFVKGDAIAAIIITAVNLLGGLLIGIMQRGMSFGEAIQAYSLLTVGDGLVSQIPALMLSVATGIVVTRGASDADMGSDLIRQFGAQQRALRLGGIAAMALMLVPGLPKVPFLIAGGSLLVVSMRVSSRPDESQSVARAGAQAPSPDLPSPDSPEALLEDMRVDPLELELSYDAVDLVDTMQGGDLLDRVRGLRRKIAMELGIVLPPVRTRDDMGMATGTYRIRVHGVEVARGEAPAQRVLAIGDDISHLPGVPTREPVFGLPAMWIPIDAQQQAELHGATVVDRASVVTTHLAEVVRTHAHRLLSREDVRVLVDVVRRTQPTVVEELTPTLLTLGEVHRTLQALLEERVPVRDLVRLFEALSVHAKRSTEAEGLVEAARAALGPAICHAASTDGRLHVLTLEPMTEQALLGQVRAHEQGSFLMVDGDVIGTLLREVVRACLSAEDAGISPVLVCAAPLRPALRRLLAAEMPRLPVLSYAELTGSLEVTSLGVVGAGVSVG